MFPDVKPSNSFFNGKRKRKGRSIAVMARLNGDEEFHVWLLKLVERREGEGRRRNFPVVDVPIS